jgi:hypothetical protein
VADLDARKAGIGHRNLDGGLMLRDLARYLAVSFVISAIAGGLYRAAVIGVLAVYGRIIVAG